MGKQFTAVNQDSKIVNQGFPIEEIIGSHQEIPIKINKIQVNILSKNCFNTTLGLLGSAEYAIFKSGCFHDKF